MPLPTLPGFRLGSRLSQYDQGPYFPELTEEEEEDLLKQVLGTGRGLLQTVGNILDVPGSFVRGLLSGDVGRAVGGIFNTEQRVGGRELFEQWGVLDRNQPGLDAGDVGGFAAEVALDPLSWLTLGGSAAARAGTAASRAGMVSKPALAKLASEQLGRKVGWREAQRHLTPRMLIEAAPEATEQASRLERFQRAAEGLRTPMDELLDLPLAGGAVQGYVPFKGPVGPAFGTGAGGEKFLHGLDVLGEAVRYGKYSPIPRLAVHFSPRSRGVADPKVQTYAEKLSDELAGMTADVRSQVGRDILSLHRRGLFTPEGETVFRESLEAVEPGARSVSLLDREGQAFIEEMAGRYRPMLDKLPAEFERTGRDYDPFGDLSGILYAPRTFSEKTGRMAWKERDLPYKHWVGGTETLRQIIKDENIVKAATDEDAYKYLAQNYGDLYLWPGKQEKILSSPTDELLESARRPQQGPDLRPAYEQGMFLEPWFHKLVKLIETDPDAALRLAGKVRPGEELNLIRMAADKSGIPFEQVASENAELRILRETEGFAGAQPLKSLVWKMRHSWSPEQRAVGGFGRHTLHDVQERVISGLGDVKQDDIVAQAIADMARHPSSFQPGEDAVPLGELLDELGMHKGPQHVPDTLTTTTEQMAGGMMTIPVREYQSPAGKAGALQNVMRRLKPELGLDPANILHRTQAETLMVPRAQAEAIRTLSKADHVSSSISTVMKVFDSATNLFKVGVLAWPARVARDLFSGQMMNSLSGNLDRKVVGWAEKLLDGRELGKEILDIPIVTSTVKARGMAETPENATDVLRELVYRHQLIGGRQGRAGTGILTGHPGLTEGAAGTVRELEGEFPGLTTFRETIQGTTWNPLAIRGMWKPGGEQLARTEFKGAAFFEGLTRWTDGMNRLVPFLTNLKRGVDPSEAARIVDGIQVSYRPENFTRSEQVFLKRAFPFYSFISRMSGEVLRQLMRRPGGGVAQSIRGANALRSDGFVPSWLEEGYAIPLGEGREQGTQRFVSGLDLMHEAPFELGAIRFKPEGGLDIGGTLGRTLQKVAGQASPYLTGPVELAFGTDLFTGRKLEDLYQFPFRAAGTEGGGPAITLGDKRDAMLANQLLASSPLSRAVTTLRKAVDTRKTTGDFLATFLSGGKLTDIDVNRARDLEAAEATRDLLSLSPRIRQFQKEYVPEELREALTPIERQLMRLRATQTARARRIAKERALQASR